MKGTVHRSLAPPQSDLWFITTDTLSETISAWMVDDLAKGIK
jgi:hypothetical protein